MITASWRDIRRIVRMADVVLEVVDARDPVATRSRRLESIVGGMGRRLLIVMNKADMVPRNIVERWKRIFENSGYPTVYVSAKSRLGTRVLRRAIRMVAGNRRPITVAVVGYPKVGKSTIINALKGRKSAPTSPIPGSPGYTRHVQFYRVGRDIRVIDTPGILPVRRGSVEAAIRGLPPEELRNPIKPAIVLITRALKHDPASIREAYGMDHDDPYKILEEIAVRRGWFYKKSGEPNVEEAARTIIRDWHKGKINFYVAPET